MVYILELKTTQAASIKIVTDAINSLLTDANFEFYPYYIDDNTSDQYTDKINESEYSPLSSNIPQYDNPSCSNVIPTDSPIYPKENNLRLGKKSKIKLDKYSSVESEEKVKSAFFAKDYIEQYKDKPHTSKISNELLDNNIETLDISTDLLNNVQEMLDGKSCNKTNDLSHSTSQSSTNIIENKRTIGGVVLKEVNKTGKILVYMRLDANKFDVYKYNYHKKKLTLGIDIGNLLKCLKCMSHFDTMSWLVDDDDINKLIVILESVEKREKKTFKLNLMDIEEETYDITPIQFPYSITLPSQDFHKYCKDMAASTDKIEIKATSKKLFFSGKGEIGNLEFEVGETNGGLSIVSTTANINEIVQGLFELKFLLIFTKCTNLCNQVTLFLKNDYPIIVTYQIAALGEIKLVLSPSKSE
jgi:proliferating cell nuclear antigen